MLNVWEDLKEERVHDSNANPHVSLNRNVDTHAKTQVVCLVQTPESEGE